MKAIWYDSDGKHIEEGFKETCNELPMTEGVKEVIILNWLGILIKTISVFKNGKFYRYGKEVDDIISWRDR